MTKEDIILLLNAGIGNESEMLFKLADKVRRQHHGSIVHLRGL